MKAIVSIHRARPPHKRIAELPSAARVDRLLTRTGKGKFAFDVPHAAIHLSDGADLVELGDLVVIQSTVAGIRDYVGVITLLEEEAGSGVVEVSGDNYTSVLYGISVSRNLSFSNRGAGDIARSMLRQSHGMGRSVFLREGSLVGTPLYAFTAPINFGSQHVGTALDALVTRTGDEWWVSHRVTRNGVKHYLNMNTRRGYDLSRRVYLEEGRDFTSVRYKRDALAQVRSVVAVGGGAPIGARPSAAVANNITGTAAQADRVEPPRGPTVPTSPLGARDYIDVRPLDADRTTLAQAAQRRYKNPITYKESVAVTIPLTRAATFAPGDFISMRFFSLHRAGFVRVIRVNAIQPDEASGEADLDVTI